MTDNIVPLYAERISFDVVCGTRKQPSKFAPTVEALVSTMRCVGCNKTHDDPGIGITLKCDCGLSTQYAPSGSVFIWRAEPWRYPAPPTKVSAGE